MSSREIESRQTAYRPRHPGRTCPSRARDGERMSLTTVDSAAPILRSDWRLHTYWYYDLRHSFRAAATYSEQRIHGDGGSDAGAGHRCQLGDLHVGERGHAEIAACERSGAALPSRRYRRLLRRGRISNADFDLLLSVL